MASLVNQRAIAVNTALHALQADLLNLSGLSDAEELQSEVDELYGKIRPLMVRLGKLQGLGDNLQSNYSFPCNWTESALQSWLESIPTRSLPTELPEYQPPKLHYSWHTALEDEAPQDILLVVSFSSDAMVLRWNTDRMRDKIDLPMHYVIAEQLYAITNKRVVLDSLRGKEIQLYPSPEPKSLWDKVVQILKSALP